jgi:hypothetical protein
MKEFGMTINDIYLAVQARGLTRSKRHFSTFYLGSAPNYISDAGFDGCSARTLLHLYRRLGEEAQADLQAMAFQRLLAVEARDGGAHGVRA